MSHIIKKCTGCGLELTAEQIVKDPEIIPIGMSFLSSGMGTAFYYFQHNAENCGTCFVVNVEKFNGLIEENIPAVNLRLSRTCNGFCTDIKSLTACANHCHNSPYRRFLLKMLKGKLSPETVK